MTRPGLFWIAYAICYALALGALIAWLMQRDPMQPLVRPHVPAHQLSVNPMTEWR